MDKSNLEEQNADEFCRNIPLEEHGCSPCPFSAKGFSRYQNEEWLKEILKPGTKIKFHGDFVKVENTRIEGLK
ncbi:7401_t:CDS:2, partial [Entrophospora sp. SA101]